MKQNQKLVIALGVAAIGITAFLLVNSRNQEPVTPKLVKDEKAIKFENENFKVRPLKNITYERTPDRRKHGEYLVTGILQCFTCHSPRNWDLPGAPPIPGKEGSGGTIIQDDSSAFLIAPNITPDTETGAGNWSDDMFARAIREGVGHDGRVLAWQMPYFTFRSLSDEDLASVIVYLRSIPPVVHKVPPTRLNALEKTELEKSVSPLTEPVVIPDMSDPIKRGQYLVRIGECIGCHTAHSEYNPGLNGGGNDIRRFGRQAFSANITVDPSGIDYGSNGFISVIRTGKGGLLSPIMPWIAFKNMNDDDLNAIYAYLRNFPTSKHAVSNLEPPSDCAICGLKHGFGNRNKRSYVTGLKVNPEIFDQYTGTYKNEYGETYFIAREGNKLMGRTREDGVAIELIAKSEKAFFGPGWVLPVIFVKDKNNQVIELTQETDYGLVFKKIK